MNRDIDKEMDSLKEQMAKLQEETSTQMEELRSMVISLMPNCPSTQKLNKVHVMHGMHPDHRLSQMMEELCLNTEEKNVSGLVTYLGVYASGERQSNWIRNAVSVDELLNLIESGVASKVLTCIGNHHRLTILLEILREPKTVATLVEKCGFHSTGQVYHHMKPLLAADVIAEDEQHKGVYVIQPHKVQGIIMLLAGISDMLDETFTQGAWEAANENQN